MALDEDSVFGKPRPKPAAHVIGQPLDDLSAPELAERIEALRAEISASRSRSRRARRRGGRRAPFSRHERERRRPEMGRGSGVNPALRITGHEWNGF